MVEEQVGTEVLRNQGVIKILMTSSRLFRELYDYSSFLHQRWSDDQWSKPLHVSQGIRVSELTKIRDKAQNAPFGYIKLTKDDYPFDLNRQVSRPVPINSFLVSAIRQIGGGELDMYAQFCSKERRGGGIDDGMKFIHMVDRPYLSPVFLSSDITTDLANLGLSRGCVDMAHFRTVGFMIRYNVEANPGPTYHSFGFRKKGDVAPIVQDIFEHLWDKAGVQSIKGYLVPRYALAGRTKLAEKFDNRVKIDEGKPLGRAVWMADAHEQLVCSVFTAPLLRYFGSFVGTIRNGFNKFSTDPRNMASVLCKFNTFISIDFSKFDQSVSPGLIDHTFNLLCEAFGLEPGTRGFNLLEWVWDEFRNTRLVLPTGKVALVEGGVPSGSGFTALVDSIVSAVTLHQVCTHLVGRDNYRLFVQGDDAVIAFKFGGGDARRKNTGLKMLERIVDLMGDNFGLTVNPEKTVVSTRVFVGYAQPRVGNTIEDASREEVLQYRMEKRAFLNRDLTFFEKFIELKQEPIGPAPGATHRWTYVFANRVKFLSHYFKRDEITGDVRMIRPTCEVVERIFAPETRVVSLRDHIERLCCAIAEHMNNHHVTNKIMHYVYDAWVLNQFGIDRPKDLKNLSTANGHKVLRAQGVDVDSICARRAWYRRIDRVVDLCEEEPEFEKFWNKLLQKASYLHGLVYSSRFSDFTVLKAIRRGLKSSGARGQGTTLMRQSPINPSQVGQGKAKSGPYTLGWSIWCNNELRISMVNLALKSMENSEYAYRGDAPSAIRFKLDTLMGLGMAGVGFLDPSYRPTDNL